METCSLSLCLATASARGFSKRGYFLGLGFAGGRPIFEPYVPLPFGIIYSNASARALLALASILVLPWDSVFVTYMFVYFLEGVLKYHRGVLRAGWYHPTTHTSQGSVVCLKMQWKGNKRGGQGEYKLFPEKLASSSGSPYTRKQGAVYPECAFVHATKRTCHHLP